MKKFKSTIYQITLMFSIWVSSTALAIGADDPFEKMTDKTDEASELLSGGFAVAICTLIIIIAAIALMMNKLRMEWAIRIMAGAFVIGSAAAITSWMMS